MPNNINLLMQTVTDELDSSSLNKTYLRKKLMIKSDCVLPLLEM